MIKKFAFALFAVMLAFALALVFHPMRLVAQEASPTPKITASPTPTPKVDEDEDEDKDEDENEDEEVDDVGEVDAEKLPASEGRFELKGRVTAVDAAHLTFAVNGLTIKVAADAKIRGGTIRALADVLVNDRVGVSGRIRDGALVADKIRVKGPDIEKRVTKESVRGLSPEAIEKLRQDIMKRIEEILKKIDELRKKQ